MKSKFNSNYLAAIFGLFLFVGCKPAPEPYPWTEKDEARVRNRKAGQQSYKLPSDNSYSGYGVSIRMIENHKYIIIQYSGVSIIHAESCECKKKEEKVEREEK